MRSARLLGEEKKQKFFRLKNISDIFSAQGFISALSRQTGTD
jgi:hypothetical protein